MTISDNLSRIRAVSFDGDMTLWDFEKVMRNSLAHALVELRKHLHQSQCVDLTVDRMIEIRNTVADEFAGQRVTLERVRLEAFRRTIATLGSDDDRLAARLNSIYLEHRFADIELYPDVLPALDSIAGRYVLGLISNGNGYPERCGLQGRFSFVVLAQNVGVEKPHPAIFEHACGHARCTPEQLIHIGDSLDTDVAGARRAGAVSVWLNRDRRPNYTSIGPDYEIHSLIELDNFLDRDRCATGRLSQAGLSK